MRLKEEIALIAVMAAVGCCAAVPVQALEFACETVARDKGGVDPDNQPFKGRFDAPGQGDVVFFAKPAGDKRRRLYLYPRTGGPSVLAREDDMAPGGGVYKRFRAPTIDDTGNVVFFAAIDGGEGLFYHPAAASTVAIALSGDPAPGGGVFDRFPGTSRLNASGDVAFAADVDGAARGIFVYDASGPAIVLVVREGDATGTGREFCSLRQACQNGASCDTVALGGLGNVAFVATTKADCTDTVEAEEVALWQQAGVGLFTQVARLGDPSPVAGTTYTAFALRGPDANATDGLLFSATVQGVLGFVGHFLFDPSGPTTTLLVATDDFAPGSGGSLVRLSQPSLTDGGRAGIGARVKDGTSRTGLFLFDGADEPVVLETDAVPMDLFGAALYKRINVGTSKARGEIGFDRSGTFVTYSAKVNDSVAPRGKLGLFRCQGS